MLHNGQENIHERSHCSNLHQHKERRSEKAGGAGGISGRLRHSRGRARRLLAPAGFLAGRGSIDAVKEKLPQLKDGAVAENIITRGLNLAAIKVGERLCLGSEIGQPAEFSSEAHQV